MTYICVAMATAQLQQNLYVTCPNYAKIKEKVKTSRDRPKSAPYPTLKNSKKTSKCQVFSFTVLENRKFYEKTFLEKTTYSKKWTEWRAERGTLPKLSTFLSQLKGFCRKTSKNWRGKNLFSEKNLTVLKKTERGDPLGFSNIHSVAKQLFVAKHSVLKKLKGDPLGKIFFPEKSRSAENNWKGGPFGVAGYGMLRGKTGKNLFGTVR